MIRNHRSFSEPFRYDFSGKLCPFKSGLACIRNLTFAQKECFVANTDLIIVRFGFAMAASYFHLIFTDLF